MRAPESFTLRLATCQAEAVRAHLAGSVPNETMLLLLCAPNGERRFVVREVIFPEAADLAVATPVAVEPTAAFKRAVWRRAFDERLVVIDLHSHVPPVGPRFSGIDWHAFRENAAIVEAEFPNPVPFGGVVVDPSFKRFSGTLWCPTDRTFHPIDRLEVVGSRLEIFQSEDALAGRHCRVAGHRYVRQQLIPGFDQAAFARLRVGVVGAGGNGAQVIMALASAGVGAEGGLVIVDGDAIETSNLNRIPFASPLDVGRNKAEVAAEFVRRHNPEIPVVAVPEFLSTARPCAALHDCAVIFGCVDGAGPRTLILDEAFASLTAVVDMGCEIRSMDDKRYESGAQVWLLFPGETCPACYNFVDFAQASLDLLSDEERAERRRLGYVDDRDAPAASIVHLNMAVAALAMNLFTRLVSGDDLRSFGYTFLDAVGLKLIRTPMPSRDGCLVCGPAGRFGRGHAGSQLPALTIRELLLDEPDYYVSITVELPTAWTPSLFSSKGRILAANSLPSAN